MKKKRWGKPRPSATGKHMAASEFRPIYDFPDVCANCVFLEIGEVCKDCGRERKNDR
jgi:hypothetical protein